MSHVDRVKDIYDKFGRGDAEGILAQFQPDIEFRLAEGHPYQPSGQPWRGRQAVTEHFFMKAGPEWEQWAVTSGEVIEMGDAVIVECRYSAIYKPTGRPLDVQVCHVWRFRDDLVASFHQYLDTARLQEVMGRR